MALSSPTILEHARENGFLNATGPGDHTVLFRAHGRWCWRLRIPMIWFERNTPRSRCGSAWLEMFTTGNRLTVRGQKELRTLAPGIVSAEGGHWEGLPLNALGDLARQIYRVTTAAGNTTSKRPDRETRGAASRWRTASA